MTKRTFQRNFTLQAKGGLAVTILLSGYLFWQKYALLGAVVAVLAVLVIEQVLHSCYTFDGDSLLIHRGRFRRSYVIHVNEIIKCTPMRTTFGLVHYLLIQYGAGHIIDVEPENEKEFMKELKRRQEAFLSAAEKE